MKTRTKIICRKNSHEVAVTLSVRSNQPGMYVSLASYEHKAGHDAVLNAIHDALRKIFDVSEMKLLK